MEEELAMNNESFEYWESDDILRELLDDMSPFLLIPSNIGDGHEYGDWSLNNLLLSSDVPYLGPTVKDIEHALLEAGERQRNEEVAKSNQRAYSMLENEDRFRVENRYTLKMRSCENGMMAEDGYKWRKYGQKFIKNSPNPRSYYRCTNPRCSAKKQVEKSSDDPETLIVTYEGLHLHFTHPFLLNTQGSKPSLSQSLDDPPAKKLKKIEAHNNKAQVYPSGEQLEDCSVFDEACVRMESKGLLQDVVPLTIRNPRSTGFSDK